MRLFSIYYYSLLLALFLGTPLSAEEKVISGSRLISLADSILLQADCEELEDVEGEASDLLISSPEGVVSFDLISRTTHPGAFHHPISIGEYITLEDGSIWKPSKGDLNKIGSWQATDLVVISTNKLLFSSYMFRLTNRNRGESIKCNLNSSPLPQGFSSHWIIAINAYTNEVCLEDGTLWQISPSDHPKLSKWMVNDTILIGLNDGLLSASRPNILINVETLTHAKANCTWQFTVQKK